MQIKTCIRTAVSAVFCISSLAHANMPYLGPAEGQVSGSKTIKNVRVLREDLTADLRKLPGGNALVFASYRLSCSGEKGVFRFLFVASSTSPVNLEIILDGKPLLPVPVISKPTEKYGPGNDGENRDSLSDIIGYDLENTGIYHYQHIMDQLFSFDVDLEPGNHFLKVGYECIPTGYESGDLRHTVFPYFLGNKKTRGKYDSIFVKVLLPEGVDYDANFECKKTGSTLVSGNIAGFPFTHITVSIYKDVTKTLAKGWTIFNILQAVFWLLVLFFTFWYLHDRIASKASFLFSLLMVIPISFIAAIAYYFGIQAYYNYFDDQFGIYLRGSWGHEYYFLIVPIVLFLTGTGWLIFSIIYRYLIYDKKWDPARYIFRRNKS